MARRLIAQFIGSGGGSWRKKSEAEFLYGNSGQRTGLANAFGKEIVKELLCSLVRPVLLPEVVCHKANDRIPLT